jgi:hypothetical protein
MMVLMPRVRHVEFPFYAQAPKELVTECNLCGGRKLKLLGMTDRYGFEAPHAKCQDCGLIFLSLRMTAPAYREFYEAGHYRRLIEAFSRIPWDNAKLQADQTRYSQSLSRWLAPHMNGRSGGLLLDIGGSCGVVAERLSRDYNLDATVVEPSISEADAARNRGLMVENVSVEDYSANGNTFGLVLLCRSVDHLLDIKATLKRVREWVAPGGLFFVDFTRQAQIKIDHPFHLTAKTMRRYVEMLGFSVKATTRHGDCRLLCEPA